MIFSLRIKKREKKNTRIIFGKSVMIILILFTFSVPRAHAQMWGTLDIFGDLMKNMLELMQRQMEGMLIGTLKVAAVQMLNGQISQLIGGGMSGRPQFITNYNTFLFQDPLQKTNLYMNDFFSLTTRGKGSSANYVSASNAGGVSGNYVTSLEQQARQATTDKNNVSVYNLDEFAVSPQAMFTEGNWRGFNAYFSNPANNAFGYTQMAEEAYQNKLAEEEEAAKVEAQSSGFLGTKSNGQITAPAGSIEATTTKVQNMGADIITNATNPAELLSGVVNSMVNRTVSSLVQNGIGTVQSSMQRQMGNVNNQVSGALRNTTQILGPSARFAPDLTQRIMSNVNSGNTLLPNNGAGEP